MEIRRDRLPLSPAHGGRHLAGQCNESAAETWLDATGEVQGTGTADGGCRRQAAGRQAQRPIRAAIGGARDRLILKRGPKAEERMQNFFSNKRVVVTGGTVFLGNLLRPRMH